MEPPRAARSALWRRWTPLVLACVGLGLSLLALYATVPARPVSEQAAGAPSATPASGQISPAPVVVNFRPAYTLESVGVLVFAWSPDGRTLATGQGNGVELWEAADGRFIGSFDVYAVSSLSWSPAGRLLAVGDSSNSIRVLDTQAGEELHPRPGNVPATPNEDAVWSPDGRRIASRFVDQAPSPASTPLPPRPMPGPLLPGPGTFSPSYGAVRLWDPSTGATERVIRMPHPTEADPHTGSPEVRKVAWSSDGRYLATFSPLLDVRVWDAATGGLVRSFVPAGVKPFEDTLLELAWQPGAHTLAVIAGRVAEWWDADTGKLVRSLPDVPPPPPPLPTAIPTVPDPLHPAPTQLPIPVPTNAQGLPITRAPQPPYLSPLPSPTYVYRDQGYRALGGLSWSPDGRALASFDGHYLRVWDSVTGRQRQRMRTHGPVLKIAWSPDGVVLASLEGGRTNSPGIANVYVGDQPAYYTGTLRIWEPNTGRELLTILPGQVSDFAWSPAGRAIAVRNGASVEVWTATGSPLTQNPTATPSPRPSLTATAGDSSALVCGSWSVVPLPALNALTSELRAVATDGSGGVWAVGYSSKSTLDRTTLQVRDGRPLILHWDGASWQEVRSPDLGSGEAVLNGVAAVPNKETGAADLWAVGYAAGPHSDRRALVLHWDGQAWHRIPTPDVEGLDSSLNAVSGSAPNEVWAVGTLGGRHTLSLRWDGVRWSRVPSPSPGIALNELTAVNAVGRGQVWAAGTFTYEVAMGAPSAEPLLLRWDGTRWKPVPVTFYGAYAGGLAVLPSGEGWLAGGWDDEGGGAGALTHIAGGQGERVLFPQLGPESETGHFGVADSGLSGLLVSATDDAWAVGHFVVNPAGASGDWQYRTLTLHWDGTAWRRVPSPDASTKGSQLNAVAADSGAVWAVGRSGSYDSPHALVMRFAGPWCAPTPGKAPTALPAATTALISPSATATPEGHQPGCALAWRGVPDDEAGPLSAVAVLPNGEAWAAGTTNGTPARTLVKRWDGARWVQVPSPSASLYDNRLYGIAGVAPNDVWAVGEYYTLGSNGSPTSNGWPLVLHWDGAAWRVVETPGVGSTGGVLQGVTATRGDDVWAAGYRRLPGAQAGTERIETLIEHWDGTSWSIVPSPNPGNVANSLYAIAGTSPQDVWAVGSFSGDGKMLILHWDGKAWSQIPSPNVAALAASLYGVAAIAKNEAWAVGASDNGEHADPLTMHWDGTQWRIVSSPKSGSHNGGQFSGVAALSPRDVWAVGGDDRVPFIDHWDGRHWSAAQLLAGGAGNGSFGSLAAVAGRSPATAWAVGGDVSGLGSSTLAMRFSDNGCLRP